MPIRYDSFKFDYKNSDYYYQDLEKLSKNRWGRSLVVQKDGRLKEVGFIKTFFNQFRKKSVKRLARLRVMHFIAYGIKEKLLNLNDQNNLSKISGLAKRAGITEEKDIDNLQKLHDQNSQVDDVIEKFYDDHQAEYKPFEEKHQWIHGYDKDASVGQRSRSSTLSSRSDDSSDPLRGDDSSLPSYQDADSDDEIPQQKAGVDDETPLIDRKRKKHQSSDNTNVPEVPSGQTFVPTNTFADRNTGSVGGEEEGQDSGSPSDDGLNSGNDQSGLRDEEPSDNPPPVPSRDDLVDHGPPPPPPYREPEEIPPPPLPSENNPSLEQEEEPAPSSPPVPTTQEDGDIQKHLDNELLRRRQAMQASIKGTSQGLGDSVDFFAGLDRKDTNPANSDGGNPIASAREIIDFTKRTTEAFKNFKQLYEEYFNSDKNDPRTALLYEQVMNALRDVDRCIELMADYQRKRPLYERGMSEVISNPKQPNYASNKKLNEQMKNSFKKLEAIQQQLLSITAARRYLSENQPKQATTLGGVMDRLKEQHPGNTINESWPITESLLKQDD